MRTSDLLRHAALLIAAGTVLAGTPILASGSIEIPETRTKLASFEACVAALAQKAAEDRKLEMPMTFDGKGGFRTVALESRTGGVQRTADREAKYEGRIWYGVGLLLDDGMIERNASWREARWACRGRTLIQNGGQGFTLNSFERATPELLAKLQVQRDEAQ